MVDLFTISEILMVIYSFLNFYDIQYLSLTSKHFHLIRKMPNIQQIIHQLYKNKTIKKTNKWTKFDAIRYKHLDLLKILDKQNNEEYTQGGINMAAGNGYVEIVKYLYQQGLKCNQDGINWAAGNGYVEMIKYLEIKGLKCNQDGINWAVGYGHLEMVKHLYTKGLKCNQKGIDGQV